MLRLNILLFHRLDGDEVNVSPAGRLSNGPRIVAEVPVTEIGGFMFKWPNSAAFHRR